MLRPFLAIAILLPVPAVAGWFDGGTQLGIIECKEENRGSGGYLGHSAVEEECTKKHEKQVDLDFAKLTKLTWKRFGDDRPSFLPMPNLGFDVPKGFMLDGIAQNATETHLLTAVEVELRRGDEVIHKGWKRVWIPPHSGASVNIHFSEQVIENASVYLTGVKAVRFKLK